MTRDKQKTKEKERVRVSDLLLVVVGSVKLVKRRSNSNSS
jgi:hypothetical protein